MHHKQQCTRDIPKSFYSKVKVSIALSQLWQRVHYPPTAPWHKGALQSHSTMPLGCIALSQHRYTSHCTAHLHFMVLSQQWTSAQVLRTADDATSINCHYLTSCYTGNKLHWLWQKHHGIGNLPSLRVKPVTTRQCISNHLKTVTSACHPIYSTF